MTDPDTRTHPAKGAAVATTPTRAARLRPYAWHYVQMLIAMTVGMMAFTPLWILAFGQLGRAATLDRPDVFGLTMATSMAVGMGLWMKFRRHSWAAIGEMSAAMYVPFLVLFPFLWAGVMSGALLMILGHVLMLPAMALAMLLRKSEYGPTHRH